MEPFSFAGYLLTAFALVFVIEGLLWAVFPEQMKRMMALALTLPSEQLRRFGATMAIVGFLLVLLFGQISG